MPENYFIRMSHAPSFVVLKKKKVNRRSRLMIKIMKIIYARNVSLSRAQIRVVGLIVQYSVYVSCAEIPSR